MLYKNLYSCVIYFWSHAQPGCILRGERFDYFYVIFLQALEDLKKGGSLVIQLCFPHGFISNSLTTCHQDFPFTCPWISISFLISKLVSYVLLSLNHKEPINLEFSMALRGILQSLDVDIFLHPAPSAILLYMKLFQ